MPKEKNPHSYPLRSREAMVNFIVHKSRSGNQDYQRINQTLSYYGLAWNVKVNRTDFSFDNLLKIYVENNGPLNNSQIEAVKAAFIEQYGEDGYSVEPKQDTARYNLFQYALERAQNSVLDNEGNQYLWGSTEKLDIEWTFSGRSGGYISVDKYEGHKMLFRNAEDFEDWLMDKEEEEYYYKGDGHYSKGKPAYKLSYAFIRTLYKFVVENDAAMTSKEAEREVNYQASDIVFLNEFSSLIEQYSDSNILLSL